MSGHTPSGRSDAEYFGDFAARAQRARVPLDGSLELTHRCNLRCVHCYLGDQGAIRAARRDELGTGEIVGLIDELVAAGNLNLTLTGGDPMVRKDFATIYTHAVRSGLLVTVFCDAVLVSDAIVEVFDRYPPRMVEVSLYGATAATYERITQVPGSFARCMAGIERLHRAGHRFSLKTVLMSLNRHELEAMEAVAASYGVDFHFDTAVFPCLPHHDNGGGANAPRAPASVDVAPPSLEQPVSLRLPAKDAAAAHLASPERRDRLASFYARTRDIPPSPYLYSCGAGQTVFHVDPYGNLQPCVISTNVDYNVREGGFRRGWDGPVAAIRDIEARAGHDCQACDKRALCTGCPALFAAENGAGDRKSPYVCEMTHAIHAGLDVPGGRPEARDP